MKGRRRWHRLVLLGLVLLLASSGLSCGECYTQEDLDAASTEAYDLGYARGKIIGKIVGLAGLESAKREAAKQGYDKGYWAGYEDAQGEGYDRGYQDGQAKGYEDGYAYGHQKGYSEGYSKGYQACRSSTPTPPPTSGNYVGSVNSDVYHYPSCRYVKQIYPENKIWFSSASDARAHGYRPCKVCCPP